MNYTGFILLMAFYAVGCIICLALHKATFRPPTPKAQERILKREHKRRDRTRYEIDKVLARGLTRKRHHNTKPPTPHK